MSFDSMPVELKQSLIFAVIAEGLCIMAGVAGWFVTGKLIWLFIGVLASFGFSLPAIFRLVRFMRETG